VLLGTKFIHPTPARQSKAPEFAHPRACTANHSFNVRVSCSWLILLKVHDMLLLKPKLKRALRS
jgi:hypothetical protein